MIRLLGAITGSALALATLLVLVGIPQFKTDPVQIERSVVTLPLATEAVDDAHLPETVAAEPTTQPASGEVQVDDALPMNPAGSPPIASSAEPDFADSAIDDVLTAESETSDRFTPDVVAPPTLSEDTADDAAFSSIDAQNWYAFWSPFRSEIAASGFVSQLQRVTGLDYRVVKTKPGVYEVAFAYVDDDDIPLNLSQITAATGLELPEG